MEESWVGGICDSCDSFADVRFGVVAVEVVLPAAEAFLPAAESFLPAAESFFSSAEGVFIAADSVFPVAEEFVFPTGDAAIGGFGGS